MAQATRPTQGRAHPTLIVASDQQLVAEAVSAALNGRGLDSRVVGPALGAVGSREFVRTALAFRPEAGLLLCDLEARRSLHEAVAIVAGLPLRWLVLTRAPQGASWGALLEAGAAGVMPMTVRLDQLTEALKLVMSGHPVHTEEWRDQLLRSWHAQREEHRRIAGALRSLTPRELAILDELSRGFTVRAIAEHSGASEETIRSQVKSILRKLHVHSQLAAVASYRTLRERS